MASDVSQNRHLAVEISTVVESCLPTQFERHAAHHTLQDKIEAVLDQNSSALLTGAAETRQVTMVLADIHGFGILAETYSAKIVLDLLNRYFALMNDVVVRYSGTIGKLMGESMMILFGTPERHSDDVERALACAISMQHAMATFNRQNKELGLPELFMGIGINTGKVVAGAVGAEQHREFAILGSEVNLASRIESQSMRGQVLISESTYKLALSYILVGQPNSVQVKGQRQPVKLYELLGTTLPRAMTVPRREVRKSPRVAVNMPCYFQLVDGKKVKSQHCKADVIDIGYYGLLIMSSVPLDVYAEVKMEVSLALLGKDTTDIYARVLQCDSVGQGFRCGLEFTTVDMAGKQTIKQFVDSMVHR